MKKIILALLLIITILVNVLAMTACDILSHVKGNDDRADASGDENNSTDDFYSKKDELILLVDSSYSMGNTIKQVDSFIQNVIDANNGARIGIVTFGADQLEVAPLSSNTTDTYQKYLNAPPRSIGATNIADAITYASTLFKTPARAKIVLISDGKVTDGNTAEAVKCATEKGIIIDTVKFSDESYRSETEILAVNSPVSHVTIGMEYEFEVVVQSNVSENATFLVYVNDVLTTPYEVHIVPGVQTFSLPLSFPIPAPNNIIELSFELACSNDTLKINNEFHTYIMHEAFCNNILILESIDGESAAIQRMLGADFDITTVSINDTHNIPKTTDEMRLYDQVILCNVSYGQMPEGFEKILYEYVADIGGGLFTVCGTETDGETPNAFTKEDLKPSQYLKKLLPVDVINFTPPVAVMILIDKSGSMYSEDFNTEFETSKLYYALQGARACLDLLSERDYIGVYELDDYGEEALELTPATERAKVLNTIQNIGKDGGGTVFSTALAAAGKTLKAQTNVEKKHIIVITDGEPDPTNVDLTKEVLLDNAAEGITTSIIGIQCTGTAESLMKQLLVEFAGVEEKNFHNVWQNDSVPDAVRDDMGAPEITDFNYEEFQIQIGATSDITKINLGNGIEHIKQEDMPTLEGFYGMKAKDADGDNNDLTKNLQVLLKGEFTPIYTQWTYGKGKVGTFGCDLNGSWSSGFIDTPEGTAILTNIVNGLMPEENIRVEAIDADYEGDNYKTQLNVYTELQGEEYVEITVTSPSADGMSASTVQKFTAGIEDNYSKFYFDLITPGVHEIIAQKKNAVGQVVSEKRIYKSIAYSKEYDMFYDDEAAAALIVNLAQSGHGELLDNAFQIYEAASQYMHKVINPLITFLIIILCFFLLDVAVRKFKWKWIHEIIREKKAKKNMENNAK